MTNHLTQKIAQGLARRRFLQQGAAAAGALVLPAMVKRKRMRAHRARNSRTDVQLRRAEIPSEVSER